MNLLSQKWTSSSMLQKDFSDNMCNVTAVIRECRCERG